MRIYILILCFIIISCYNNDKGEDVISDFSSGMINSFYHGKDVIIEGLKGVSTNLVNSGETVFNAIKTIVINSKSRADAVVEVAKQRSDFLKKALKSYSLFRDETMFHKTLKELNDPNFFKKCEEIVDKTRLYPIKRMTPSNKVVGKAVGKYVGKMASDFMTILPFFSAGLNGYEAVKKFSRGEIVGGTLKVAEVGVSFIPGISFAQSMIPTVASIIYDIAK